MNTPLTIISHETMRAARTEIRAALKPKRFKPDVQMMRLITTSDGIAALAQSITIDVAIGREDVPVLYKPLYRSLTNADLPRLVPTDVLAEAAIIFLERVEGGEVHFGHMAPGSATSVPIRNWAAGFEYTRENAMYNELWALAELARSSGEAFNALLNHLHLGPFLTFTYTSANQTAADATGATTNEKVYNTFFNALQTAALAKRPGSILLAATADQGRIERAMTGWNDNNNNTIPAIRGINQIIYYDGWSTTVGPKTYSYPGVTPGKCYLIQPQRKLRELIKIDFEVVPGNPDVSRGIEDQITYQSYRGIYADIAGSTEEITLPA